MRIGLSAGLGLSVFTVVAPALADHHCAAIDLTCLAGDATSDVEATFDRIAAHVKETTDPLIQQILHEVDVILGGGEVEPPGGRGTGGGNGRAPGGTGGGPSAEPGRDDDLAPGPSVITSQQVFDPTGIAPDAPTDLRRGAVLGSGPRAGIGGIVAGAAGSALVVLVLLGITLAFVLIQGRLDRNDPKLALARVTPDVLGFE